MLVRIAHDWYRRMLSLVVDFFSGLMWSSICTRPQTDRLWSPHLPESTSPSIPLSLPGRSEIDREMKRRIHDCSHASEV